MNKPSSLNSNTSSEQDILGMFIDNLELPVKSAGALSIEITEAKSRTDKFDLLAQLAQAAMEIGQCIEMTLASSKTFIESGTDSKPRDTIFGLANELKGKLTAVLLFFDICQKKTLSNEDFDNGINSVIKVVDEIQEMWQFTKRRH